MKDEATPKKHVFTRENLLESLDKLGPWSTYFLAVQSLQHYFPDCDFEENSVEQDVQKLRELGCDTWQDAIIKYHTEIGYKGPLVTTFVNEY